MNIKDGSEIWLSLGYWARCLSEPQAQSLAFTVRTAITSVLENPNQLISAVSMVGKEQMQQFQSWNAKIPESIHQCIHHTIEQQALTNPEAPAVYSTESSMSLNYRQFNEMADTLAKTLTNLGVGPESLVPFCMDKSPLTPIVMIAILKAGGACVALDPSHPIQRLQSIIRDSEATVILAAPSHASKFIDLVSHVLPVNEDMFIPSAEFTDQGVSPLAQAVNHGNPAFVISTSGSTGTPKGIVVEHGAFCSSARSHAAPLRIQRGSRVLQFASYTYDLSIAETFTTLMVGACICVPSEFERLNRLADAINAMQVDWMSLTPTVAALVRPEQVPTIKTLVLGGEHATENNLATWGSRSGVCLINSYGPAECAICTNANTGVQTTADTSNIGGRLGCSLWIVDPRNHDRLLPTGARGEIVIGGPTLERGYLHDHVKTNAAFIRDPAWADNNTGSHQAFYKSGDLARYNADGSLCIQGRKDTQVKVNGHRIELGDIDLNMACIPCIEHAAARLPCSSPQLRDRLVAVLSLQELATSRDGHGNDSVLKIINQPDHKKIAIQQPRFLGLSPVLQFPSRRQIKSGHCAKGTQSPQPICSRQSGLWSCASIPVWMMSALDSCSPVGMLPSL